MTRPGGMAGASTWRMRYQDSSVKNKKLAAGTRRSLTGTALRNQVRPAALEGVALVTWV